MFDVLTDKDICEIRDAAEGAKGLGAPNSALLHIISDACSEVLRLRQLLNGKTETGGARVH